MARRNRVLRLSPRAENDLEAIYDYTVEHWSVRQATAYLRGLNVTLLGLARGRRIGRDAEFDNGMMKIIHESHVVYYQVTDLDIHVVRILHTSMDAPRHLGQSRITLQSSAVWARKVISNDYRFAEQPLAAFKEAWREHFGTEA